MGEIPCLNDTLSNLTEAIEYTVGVTSDIWHALEMTSIHRSLSRRLSHQIPAYQIRRKRGA